MPVNKLSVRLVLRKKDAPNSMNPIEHPLVRKLKLNDYDSNCLSIEDQSSICSLIEFKTGFMDVQRNLKVLGLGLSGYKFLNKPDAIIKNALSVFKCLVQLTEHNIMIDPDLAVEICEYWNSLIDEHNKKNFRKIKIFPKSKMIQCMAVFLTYILKFKTNSVDKIKNAIRIVLNSETRIRAFAIRKNTIYDVFARIIFNEKYEFLFEAKNALHFNNNLFYKGSAHPKLFDGKFKEMFIRIFFSYNEEKGNEIFTKYKITLSNWFDTLSIDFIPETSRRDLCGLKLMGRNDNINSIMEEYFHFMSMQKTHIVPMDIVKSGWWASFVDHVRFSLGYSNFWKYKIALKVDKPK